MWTEITHEDIQRAKAELTHSHFQTDLRHAEELEELHKRHKQERDELAVKLAKLETVEREIEAFVREYLPLDDGGAKDINGISVRPREVEVVATWEKTKLGFRAA